jgi:16S rRNA (guanine(966)-N(2))-methyltransferase RsmD
MPGLRVIGGSARGRPLRRVPGDGTRPIGDRAKEALFGILGADVEGSTFLDLFAGTGSVGIEALSRGATAAVFVDKAAAAARTVRENLASTGFDARAVVVQRDSFAYLAQDATMAFDYIYIAPPQYHGMWLKVLRALEDKPGWMSEDAWAIVQIDPREDEAEGLARFERFDERSYGQTRLIFYQTRAA